MTSSRVNPFQTVDELPTFDVKPKATKPIAVEAIARVAEANGFPSRQPSSSKPAKNVQGDEVSPSARRRVRRRFRTGRNQQINIKATAEAIERLYRIADERRLPLGEILELALQALENRHGLSAVTAEKGEPHSKRNAQPKATEG